MTYQIYSMFSQATTRGKRKKVSGHDFSNLEVCEIRFYTAANFKPRYTGQDISHKPNVTKFQDRKQ